MSSDDGKDAITTALVVTAQIVGALAMVVGIAYAAYYADQGRALSAILCLVVVIGGFWFLVHSSPRD